MQGKSHQLQTLEDEILQASMHITNIIKSVKTKLAKLSCLTHILKKYFRDPWIKTARKVDGAD